MARVRRSAAERARLIDEWRASGVKLPACCAGGGLNAKTMSGWSYKTAHKIAIENARREAPPASRKGRAALPSRPTSAFPPVRVVEQSAARPVEEMAANHAPVEIVLSAGRGVASWSGRDLIATRCSAWSPCWRGGRVESGAGLADLPRGRAGRHAKRV